MTTPTTSFDVLTECDTPKNRTRHCVNLGTVIADSSYSYVLLPLHSPNMTAVQRTHHALMQTPLRRYLHAVNLGGALCALAAWRHSAALFAITGATLIFVIVMFYLRLRHHQRAEQMQRAEHAATIASLTEAKATADAANQAKTRYLSGVSHELRTPLNTIYGYAQLLERDSNLPESARKAAYSISKGGEHLTDIIEGLLEISKIEARRVDFLNKEPVDLHHFLQLLSESFTMQAEAKGIAFAYNATTPLPQTVSTDVKRLRQVLMNLLSNAIRFTSTGQVTFNVSYRNEVAKFSVSDTGIGISSDAIGRIFEPFERVHAHPHRIPGTGLGLSISRLIADLLGGDIAVESTLGQGSTFTFSVMLPRVHTPSHSVNNQVLDSAQLSASHLEPATATATTPAITDVTRQRTPSRKGTVLVVDDDPTHRDLIHQLLTPQGFTVLLADNMVDVFAQVQKHTIHLFLLDVQMPEADGWSIAQALRHKGVQAPIFMLSGNAVEAQPERMQSDLHCEYLVKPIQFDTLLDKIRRTLHLENDKAPALCTRETHAPAALEASDKTDRANDSATNLVQLHKPKSSLYDLLHAASIGSPQGVADALGTFTKEHPNHTHIQSHIQQLLAQYDFPAITECLQQITSQPNADLTSY